MELEEFLEYYTVLVPSVHGVSDFRVSPESFFDLFGWQKYCNEKDLHSHCSVIVSRISASSLSYPKQPCFLITLVILRALL